MKHLTINQYQLPPADKAQVLPLTVYLEPHNEGHMMCYSERIVETPTAIVVRAKRLLDALEENLPAGTFTVKIINYDLNDEIYLDRNYLYDAGWQIIGEVCQAEDFLLKQKKPKENKANYAD